MGTFLFFAHWDDVLMGNLKSVLEFEAVVEVGASAYYQGDAGPEDYSFGTVKKWLEQDDHAAEDKHSTGEDRYPPAGIFAGAN